MLGGYTELFLQRAVFPVFLQNRLILSVKSSGIEKEFRAVIGQRHASAVAVKQRNPQLFFQLPDSAGQGRLRYIQLPGGLVD